ncbi:MtrAB system histidine kinase MtrB [Psychromicrobium xiongbiense]|uniref:MtrAB system histidine kinase MtrB n=1 Tax=Psychromicrobium xiongbiense TaxID=3051184 RepID=UPI002554385E|nr:MtrAB system histidine kinase MtrB [Psychromicrobium sp. YIM S02556]
MAVPSWWRRGWAWTKREFAWVFSRWRRSLQFRTVSVTMLAAFLVFCVLGIFLSNQIAQGLFKERLQQATTDNLRGVTMVQDAFDAAQVSDKAGLSVLARGVLSSLNTGESDNSRLYLMTVVPGQTNPLSVASLSSDGFPATAIPDDLRSQVRALPTNQLGVQLWKSIALPVGSSGTHPAIAIGTLVRLSSTTYELYMVYDLNKTQDTLNYIQSVLLISGAALLLLIGGIIWYVTRSVVTPVSAAATVAEKLAAGGLQERMDARGEDEMARLSLSFNKMAAALQDQITQLAALSEMQRNFVSDVSHELRTPLTTVRMAAEVLYDARDGFDPVSQRSAELMYHQVERFQALLADLLEISRFDAGAALLDAEPGDLFAVIQQVVDQAAPLAEQIGSELRILSSMSDRYCVVEMDPRRIERIVRNLVVNALEHGEGHPVEVHIAADEEVAAIAVRDYGIGMAEEDLVRVFDRFWRADPARARTTGGSGLGLAIATEDANLHRGRLEVWASPGKGSCFRLTLPRHQGDVIDHTLLDMPPGTEAGGPIAFPPTGILATVARAPSFSALAELTSGTASPQGGTTSASKEKR